MTKHRLEWHRIVDQLPTESLIGNESSILLLDPSLISDDDYVGHPVIVSNPAYVISGKAQQYGFTHWASMGPYPLEDFDLSEEMQIQAVVGAHSCAPIKHRLSADQLGNYFHFLNRHPMPVDASNVGFYCVNMWHENFVKVMEKFPEGLDDLKVNVWCGHFAYICDERIPKQHLCSDIHFVGHGFPRSTYRPYKDFDDLKKVITQYHYVFLGT